MATLEIEKAETDLVRDIDFCFVTAEALLTRRRELNQNTYYFPNVADFDHFSKSLDAATPLPDDLRGIPTPRIGFIGAMSGYKVDFALLRLIALAHPDWNLVLIGKVGEGDPWTDTSEISSIKNIHLVGPRSYEELPSYLKGMDVAMLPCHVNDYTTGMFPMKFFDTSPRGVRLYPLTYPR